MERTGTDMKKRACLLFVYFAIFCTAILAGCSCTKVNDNPADNGTTPILLTITNKGNVDNCYVVDGNSFAYIGSTLKLDYQIQPSTSTSNEVSVYITGRTSAAQVVSTTSNGLTGSVILTTLDKGVVTVTIQTKSTPIRSDHFTFEVVDPTTLASPMSLHYDNGYLIWNKVQDATSYELVIADNGVDRQPVQVSYEGNNENAVQYKIPNGSMLTGHEYTAKVKAKGNGTTTADSAYSTSCYFTILDTVTNVHQESGVLTFQAVPRATQYELELAYVMNGNRQEETMTLDGQSGDEVRYSLTQAYENATQFRVRVRALHPSTDSRYVYIPSDWTEGLDIVQLGKVSGFEIDNSAHASVISWQAIPNAIGYNIMMMTPSGQTVLTTKVTSNEYRVDESLASGNYQLLVWAYGADNAIDGESSETFAFTKIDSVHASSIKLTGNMLTFASVQGVEQYEITYENETHTFTDIITGNKSVVGEKIEEAGTYTISIRTIAKSDTGLNLVNGNKVNLTNLTVQKLANASIRGISNYGTKSTINDDTLGVQEMMSNWVGPTLTWQEVLQATSYTIYLAKEGQTPNTVAVVTDRLSYEFGQLEAGNYTAWVQANGVDGVISSTVKFDSANQDAFSFKVLPATSYESITFDQNKQQISFASVTGTTAYLVRENEQNACYYIGNDTHYQPRQAREGSNTITIFAWGNGLNTVVSSGTTYTFEKLYAPTSLSTNNGMLVIEPNSSYEGMTTIVYEIEVSVAGRVTQTMTTTALQVDLGSRLAPNTTYSLRVRATQTGKLHSDYTASYDVQVLTMTDVKATRQEDQVQLSWETVLGATSYTVVIVHNNEIVEQSVVTDTKYVTTSIAEQGKYTAKVRAMGSGEQADLGYLSSYNTKECDFYRLARPNVTMKNGQLSWTSGDLTTDGIKAKGYLVTFSNGDSEVVDTLTYVATLPAGTYSATVQALGDDTVIISSVPSASYEFTKLGQASLSLSQGKLTIVDTGVTAGVTGTKYSLYNMTTTSAGETFELVKADISSTLQDVGEYLTQGMSYQLVVQVTHNDYMTSTLSATNVKAVEKLATSTAFVLENNEFHWQGVSHATGYELKCNQGMTYHEQFDAHTTQSVLPTLSKSGAYTFELVAVGDDTKYVSSTSTKVDTYKLPQVSNLGVKNGVLAYEYRGSVTPVRFELTIKQNEESFVVNNHNQRTFAFRDTADKKYQGTYLVGVTVLGNGSSTITSEPSEYYQVTKLDPVTNVKVGVTSSLDGLIRGQLSWQKPVGAASSLQYALSINGKETTLVKAKAINDYETGDKVGYFFFEKDGYYYFTGSDLLLPGVDNHITVRVFDHESEGYIDSEPTTDAIVRALNAPSNVQVNISDENSQVLLTWDQVEGATKYAIYQVLNTDATTGMSTLNLRTDLGDNGRVTTNSCVIINADKESMTRRLVVLAIGSNDQLLSGNNTYWTSGISSIVSYTTLGQVADLRVDEGVLTWNGGKATKFNLDIYEYQNGIEENYLMVAPMKSVTGLTDTSYALDEVEGNKKYFIAIYPLGNNSNTISNHVASTIAVTKMPQLSGLKVIDGVLTWDVTYESVNNLMTFPTMTGAEVTFGLEQAKTLSQLIDKRNNGLLSSIEKEYLTKLEQLVTFELAVAKANSNLSSIGQRAYKTCYVTGIKPLTDHMVLTYDDMLFDNESSMLSEAGYYQINVRNLGNSGALDATYDLFVNASYTNKVTTVYRSPVVQQVELGSGTNYRKSYIHNEYITFVKIPKVVNQDGMITTQDVDYIVEFEHVTSTGTRQVQTATLSASDINDKQNGEISLRKLLELNSDIKLNAGTVYYVRVRVRGTADSTRLDENQTLILRSAIGSSSRLQILSTASIGISSGELYWLKGATSNALSYEIQGYSLPSYTDEVQSEQVPVITRTYDATVANYQDLDDDFMNLGLTHGWYAFRVRAVGNGSEYITGDWSEYQKVYRLPDIVQNSDEIRLSSGDFAWTPNFEDSNVTSAISSKVLVYRSASKEGAYTSDKEDYTIIKGSLGGQSRLVLSDKYAKTFNGSVQYYKVAVANMVADENQPDSGYMYLRSGYTLMNRGYSRLDEPTGLRISNGKVVWDAVGTQFEVVVNGEALGGQSVSIMTSGTSFSLDLDSRFKAGVYSVRVRNVADSIMSSLSSTYSSELIVTKYKAPDLRLEKGHIVWNTSQITSEEDTTIASIEVGIYVGEEELFSASYDHTITSIDLNEIKTLSDENLQEGVEYTITVGYKVGEDNTIYVDGEVAKMNFTILPSVVLRADTKSDSDGIDNYIAWQGVTHAKGYTSYLYYKNNDGTFTYISSEEVTMESMVDSTNFAYDESTNTVKYKVPRIEGKIYRIYVEAMGDSITTLHRDDRGLYASSLMITATSYMDIELPTCPQVDVTQISQSHNGYITWTNMTESAYPVVEYQYRKRAGEATSDAVVVVLPKNTTEYYLPTIAGEYVIKVYAKNDLGANSTAVSLKTSFTSYNDGDGTSENPYLISNELQFNAMRERSALTNWAVDGGRVHFKVTGDIVLTNAYTTIDPFYAVLTGQDNEQGNCPTITLPSNFDRAVFGQMMTGASIENIKIQHTINVTQNTYSLLADSNMGTIRDVEVTLGGTYTISHFAGIVMTNTGTITGVTLTFNNVTIQPYSTSREMYVSLVTEENSGSVDHVTLSGRITAKAITQGEIILAGVAYKNTNRVSYVTNYAMMSVNTGSKDYQSTLVGLVYNNMSVIEYCGVETTLQGNMIGGLVYNNYASIDNSYFVGSIQATRISNSSMTLSVGGLVCNNQNAYYEGLTPVTTNPTITNCYVVMRDGITIRSNVTGLSDGYAHIGGLVCNNNVNATQQEASIRNCYVAISGVTADVSGYHYGIIAYSSTAKLNNYPLLNNVYYDKTSGYSTLIRVYNGTQHITTSDNTLGIVGVMNYAKLDEMSGLRTTYKEVDWSDHVVLSWQTDPAQSTAY